MNGMLMAAAPTTVSMVIVSLPHLKGRNYGAIAAGRFDLGQTVEAVAPASCEARLLRRLHGGNLEGVKLVVVVIADRDIFARNEDMGAEAIAGFVVVGCRIVLKDPKRMLRAARLVHEMTGLVVVAPEAPHATLLAVLLPELGIDMAVGIERSDKFIAV